MLVVSGGIFVYLVMRGANPKLCMETTGTDSRDAGLAVNSCRDLKAMGPILYVMAILGCGEADTCQQVAVAPAQYRSIDECNAATGAEVERRQDLAFPVVVAQCQRADSKLAQEVKPADVDLPDAPRQPAIRQASLKKGFARS